MRKLLTPSLLGSVLFLSAALALTQQRAPAPGAGARGGCGARCRSADWPTFGGDNARSNANMAATRITAANVGSMVRQQVTISAPIDAGLIYLRGVQVNGASHDVFFGTTNLGRTVAIDANEAKVLWEFAPPNFDEATAIVPQRGDPDGNPFNGAKHITNSSPVADANRQFIYAASADGKVNKISKNQLPLMYYVSVAPREGGLISYGIDLTDLFGRSASYVDRILRGAKPAELPVQLPTKFELAINLKTAKALGLTVPTTLLTSANEVIE